MCRTEDLHLMLRQLRDDQREEPADETVAHGSVNFEQKSRNLSQRKWYVAGSGINVAVKYLDSGYDGQEDNGPDEETQFGGYLKKQFEFFFEGFQNYLFGHLGWWAIQFNPLVDFRTVYTYEKIFFVKYVY